MTVRELCNKMGADELAEWVAYERLNDEKQRKVIEQQIADDLSEEEKHNKLRAFLCTIAKGRKNGQ